jgi:hypothetical protein
MCGDNFHAECIRIWLREQRDKTPLPTVASAVDDGKATASQHNSHQKSSEGYVNLGTIQGQQFSTRDTSTYRTVQT